jgi:hypothetical protein
VTPKGLFGVGAILLRKAPGQPSTLDGMASSGKRKTTMAKLNRERKVLEKRQEKKARKVVRKQATADGLGTEAIRGNNADDEV